MAGIAVRGTTYNLPNYHGEVFLSGRSDTPFLSRMGGLQGGVKTIDAWEWEWQQYDLRAASATRQRLEGADAPTAEARVRVNVSNVTEIHHEQVDISYTKLASVGKFDGVNTAVGSNPVANELAWQIQQQYVQMARDIELSFLTGTYNKPADNTTARRTRGLLGAITTNVRSMGGSPAALTRDGFLDAMEMAWQSGGLQTDEGRVAFCNSNVKRQVTDLFIANANYQQTSATVGGVAAERIDTDFGPVFLQLCPAMPTDQLLFASVDKLQPVATEIPNKGILFIEPLAKTGSAEKAQLYGELGLEYGLEIHHAKVTNILPV